MAELPTAVAAGSRCGEAYATATVGVLDMVPNSPNVIPGEVVVVTDLRAADPSRLPR
jgi:hypothetical protein